MKFIYKLLALFLIPLLTLPVAMASTDNTMPDNNTIVDNDTNTDPVEPVQPIDSVQVFCAPDGNNYIQHFVDKDIIMEFAGDSKAQGNSTFEKELIAYDDRIAFDTYLVSTNNGERYTVVVVYTKGESYDDFGRAQLYFNQHNAAIVRPAPMAICKNLNFQSLNTDWKFKTDLVKSYKIVYSHYGREIDEDVPVETPIEHEEPIVHIKPIRPEPPHMTPINDIDVDNSISNSTVQNISSVENRSMVQDNTSVNFTANVSNTTDSINVIGSNVNGDIINIDSIIGSISNVTNSIINLYINYT